MQCPSCSVPTVVIDAREDDSDCSIRRRRQCSTCQLKFTSIETVSLMAIKRAGVTEPFSRTAVIIGVRRAAQGSPRVVDALARCARSRWHALAGSPACRLPDRRRTGVSMSGAWSPFSLVSASGRG
ncbi:NrdR family transcriptional regulator [Streptomyces hirsutus]|uniref:NrdR family transcriptional regulator n=1 Tax=Streptomyces hirsutus TaxID=35620 RepID=UPI003F4D7158